MKLRELLDRYIEGVPGSYYFCRELIWGRQIAGGQFFYKQQARDCLLRKITEFLDDPEAYIHDNGPREVSRERKLRSQPRGI